MLTPQEAEAHVFPKASFGGYSMQQVDLFLDTLIEDYRTLYQENVAVKNKLKILVDKIEEYRATEDAMRITLHSAQKTAEALVREGEAQKQAIIDQAVEEVRLKSEEARAQMASEEAVVQAQLDETKKRLADEQTRLQAARAATTAYLTKLKDLYTHEIEFLGTLSTMTAADAAPVADPTPAEEPAPAEEVAAQENAAKEIEQTVAEETAGTDGIETRPFTQDE